MENRKINIYYNGQYICSTIRRKTVKEAKENFISNPVWQGLKVDGTIGECKIDNIDITKVKCSFAEQKG